MRNCRNNVINEIKGCSIANLPVDSVPDDLVVVTLQIEGKPLEVMVDSGAGLSVIDHESITKMNTPIQPGKGNLKTFEYEDVPASSTSVVLDFT